MVIKLCTYAVQKPLAIIAAIMLAQVAAHADLDYNLANTIVRQNAGQKGSKGTVLVVVTSATSIPLSAGGLCSGANFDSPSSAAIRASSNSVGR